MAVGTAATYVGLHLGCTRTVQAGDVGLLLSFSLHLLCVGSFLQLCSLEGDACSHGLRNLIIGGFAVGVHDMKLLLRVMGDKVIPLVMRDKVMRLFLWL